MPSTAMTLRTWRQEQNIYAASPEEKSFVNIVIDFLQVCLWHVLVWGAGWGEPTPNKVMDDKITETEVMKFLISKVPN